MLPIANWFWSLSGSHELRTTRTGSICRIQWCRWCKHRPSSRCMHRLLTTCPGRSFLCCWNAHSHSKRNCHKLVRVDDQNKVTKKSVAIQYRVHSRRWHYRNNLDSSGSKLWRKSNHFYCTLDIDRIMSMLIQRIFVGVIRHIELSSQAVNIGLKTSYQIVGFAKHFQIRSNGCGTRRLGFSKPHTVFTGRSWRICLEPKDPILV